MAELISMYFNALISEVNALAIPREYRDDMLAKLQFLRDQSLCDYDRRKPTSELREVWKNVDRAMAQHGLYERYKPSKKAWETIGMFVEIAQFRPTPSKKMAAPLPPSPYGQMTVTQLLEAMNAACGDISFIKVRTAIRASLKYLEEESKKPVSARDLREIAETWRRIHPELKKRAILRPFEEEPMKSRLMDFLKGHEAVAASELKAAR